MASNRKRFLQARIEQEFETLCEDFNIQDVESPYDLSDEVYYELYDFVNNVYTGQNLEIWVEQYVEDEWETISEQYCLECEYKDVDSEKLVEIQKEVFEYYS